MPGGCAIGSRPVDLHLKAMEALGARIDVEAGYVVARTPPGGLVGGRVVFEKITVGGTENALTAALAKGETVIENAAREPEIVALAQLLRTMGVEIEEELIGFLCKDRIDLRAVVLRFHQIVSRREP